MDGRGMGKSQPVNKIVLRTRCGCTRELVDNAYLVPMPRDIFVALPIPVVLNLQEMESEPEREVRRFTYYSNSDGVTEFREASWK